MAVSSGCAAPCCWHATATAFACSNVTRPLPRRRDQDPWGRWERRGVNQFQLLHGFLPRFRELLDAELPDVTVALEADGAARVNRLADLPDAITGGRRPGDERFDAVTGRRPMVEATLARLVDAQPGVEVCRGVAVRGLLAGDARTAAHRTSAA